MGQLSVGSGNWGKQYPRRRGSLSDTRVGLEEGVSSAGPGSVRGMERAEEGGESEGDGVGIDGQRGQGVLEGLQSCC